MSIAQADLKYYQPEEVSDLTSNGGGMSDTQIISAVKNNLWPNITYAQRTSATDVLLYRKVFCKPASDTSDALISPRVWNHSPTPGDDFVYMFAGTKTDTEATFDNTRKYGAATLASDCLTDSTTAVVTVESTDLTGIFASGDLIRLSAQTIPGGPGNYEDVTLSSTAPQVSGTTVTLYLNTAVTMDFYADATVVSSCYQPGDTEAAIGTVVVTSASGITNEDDSALAPTLNNTGTRDETLTVTFSTATAFSVTGSKSGSLGSGTKDSTFTAYNPTNGKVLITLPAGFFSGTWSALDTVEIPTISNSFAFWLCRTIPVGSSVFSGDENITAYLGESE